MDNDHDLLIEISTTLKSVKENQDKQIETHRELVGRVTALEAIKRGDSEKFRTLTDQMRQTLNNSDRITNAYIEINSLKVELKALKEDIEDLKKKSSLFDTINAIGATAAGVVGYIFGGK